MSRFRRLWIAGIYFLFSAMNACGLGAQEIKTVFVIAMENHNWTQPGEHPWRGPADLWKSPTRHSLTVL